MTLHQFKTLTEFEIEMRVQWAIDRLDRDFLLNKITQEQYDRDIVSIDKWSSQQYEHSKYQES